MPLKGQKVNTMNKNFTRLLIGSGESSPEIRYLTGISTPDDFICFETPDGVTALMSKLEISRARSCAKPGVAVLPESDFGTSRQEIITGAAKIFNTNCFEVPPEFPLGLAEKLNASGIKLHVSESDFCPGRRSKDKQELQAVIDSQRAGEAGFARAVRVLEEATISPDGLLIWNGETLTSEILRAEIDSTILKHNALPTGTICAGAKQSSQPHNQGSGPLYAHTPIVMDIFPRSSVSGYWGDLTRTVVKGKAPEIVKRAYEAVKKAREYAKSKIALNVSCAELHLAAESILDQHRFFTGTSNGEPFGFFHGLGHGVGLEIHESPRLSPRSKDVLTGGEIFTVEPGVYYPEWGGIRLEDLIYLAPDGKVHCLTRAPDFLEIF